MAHAISVSIVEDDQETLASLATLIRKTPGLMCLHTYSTAEEALSDIPADPPDVLLVDIRLPGMSGIECVAQLKSDLHHLNILMLTTYEESELIFESLRSGASGYLLKNSSAQNWCKPSSSCMPAVRPCRCLLLGNWSPIINGRRIRNPTWRLSRSENRKSFVCSLAETITGKLPIISKSQLIPCARTFGIYTKNSTCARARPLLGSTSKNRACISKPGCALASNSFRHTEAYKDAIHRQINKRRITIQFAMT